jgi:hypothetical protein
MRRTSNIYYGIMSSLKRLKKAALISHMSGRAPTADTLFMESLIAADISSSLVSIKGKAFSEQ